MPLPAKHHFVYAKEFVFDEYRPSTIALLAVSAAFAENVNRVRSLGALPIQLVGASAFAQLYDEEARKNLNIPAGDNRYTHGHADFDLDLNALRQKEKVRLSKEHVAKAREGKAQSFTEIGEINLGLMLTMDSSPMMPGAEAILSGMVIGSWTALETLAGDLWKEALNFHPKKLASLSGTWHAAERIESDELDESNEELSDKKIELRDLQINDYDLSKHMGSVLRRRYKWGVLESIRLAYSDAFSKHFAEIKSAIEHSSVDALASARNVLVHKGGMVDNEFIRKCKGWGPFGSAEKEKPLELTGVIVRDLLTESLGNGVKLLKSVNDWLINH
jgi:hypothetical protein